MTLGRNKKILNLRKSTASYPTRGQIEELKSLGIRLLSPEYKQHTFHSGGPVFDEIITFGKYFSQLRPFLQYFDKEDFLFIDGDNIIKKPQEEFGRITNFFCVAQELKFKYEEKGFYCLEEPVEMCLSKAKG